MDSTENKDANCNPDKEKASDDLVDGTGISKTAQVTSKVNQISTPAIRKEVANPAWPFKSSETNYKLVKEEYSKSPVEKFVATAFGDELPAMRNELIKRKHSGEGFVERHVHAWSHLENWKIDPDNENKEKSDPIVCKDISENVKQKNDAF